ncbi:phage tail protein, partial [bacterium]|nr:phage tail protein [bacterium]
MNSLAQINDTNLKIFDEICAERISAINLDVLNLANIDTLPSDALPHLAEQYHITGEEGWIFCKNEQEKRALLKKAIKLHKYKGTKFA